MLILLLIIPLLTGCILFALKKELIVKQTAFISSLIELGLTLWLAIQFNAMNGIQFEINSSWIPQIGANFHIGIDGISLMMLILTNLLIPFIILVGFNRKQEKFSSFYALLLIMQSALIGVFISLNAFLFYIFWELALVPIFFIILIWGGEHRQSITLKFFIYTLVGSLLLLAGFIVLNYQTPGNSFELSEFLKLKICPCMQQWLFWLIFIGFAIKIPVFPLHTWQPDTYTTAPVQGTMLLSGIMLKMGIYGIIRWLLPVLPAGVDMWRLLVIIFSIVGVIYASILAFRQKDLKTFLAYSSIAHVGLITAGMFALNLYALQGAMIQMLAHGINIVGLFFIVDIIQNKLNTRQINELGGIKNNNRYFAILFLIILLGSIALPLTNGFVGEFLLFIGIYQYNFWIAAISGLSIIFGAIYMLYMYQKTMLGEKNNISGKFSACSISENIVLISLSTFVIFFGVYPQIILNITEKAIELLLKSLV